MKSDLIACQNCAKLKVTCDRNTPCSQCVRRQVACQPRVARRRQDSRTVPTQPKDFLVNWSSTDVEATGNGGTQHPRVTTSSSFLVEDHRGGEYGSFQGTLLASSTAYQTTYSPPSGGASELRSLDSEDLCHTEAHISATSSNGAGAFGPNDFYFMEDISTQRRYGNEVIEYSSSVFNDLTTSSAVSPPENSLEWCTVTESPAQPSERAQKRRHIEDQQLDSGNSITHGTHSLRPPIVRNDTSKLGLDSSEGFDASWSSFRCNPESDRSLINVARHSLEGLSLQDFLPADLIVVKTQPKVGLTIEPLDGPTRDKLLASNSAFSEKAVILHRVAFLTSQQPTLLRVKSPRNEDHVFVLPPSSVLGSFLSAYALRCEHSYPSIGGGTLSPNSIMHNHSTHGALQVLLMLALGSMADTTSGAIKLSEALTESCRVRLHEMLERSQSFEHTILLRVLRSGLLFTLLGGWSGSRFYMDLALAQHGLYLPMLRQFGMVETREVVFNDAELHGNLQAAWESWKANESRKRLVHSCTTMVLELSVFHDLPCSVSVGDLEATVPSPESLWNADSAPNWYNAYCKYSLERRPAELLPWFRSLTIQDVLKTSPVLEPLELRCCLNLLAILVYAVAQMQQCLPLRSGLSGGSNNEGGTPHAQMVHRDVTCLLSVWSKLARQTQASAPVELAEMQRPAMLTNHVMYHVIHLNTLVYFKDIEKIAREGPSWKAVRLCSACVASPLETWIHAGQVLRILRLLPPHARPLWWAAAVYRAAIASWAASVAHVPPHAHRPMLAQALGRGSSSSSSSDGTTADGRNARGAYIAIDAIDLDDPALDMLRSGSGCAPVLTNEQGDSVSLTNPPKVLDVFIEILESDNGMSFVQGIRDRLKRLVQRWNT